MADLRNRIKLVGATGKVVEKWNTYIDQFYSTAEGKRLVETYLANSTTAIITVKLIPGGSKNFVLAMGNVNIGLASQSGFGLKYVNGKDGSKILLSGLRTLTHEMYHALSPVDRHNEQLAVEFANKVIKQFAVLSGNPAKAGVRGDYYNNPAMSVPFGSSYKFLD